MRRTTLILVIVLAVVIVAGAGWLWIRRGTYVWPWAGTTNTTTNTVAGTNTTVVNVSTLTNSTPIILPTEVKGDTAISGTMTVNGVVVTFSSMQKQTTFDTTTAEKGQTFVRVFFDPITPTSTAAVNTGLKDAKLVTGTSTYAYFGIKVGTTAVKGDRGFVQFQIPESSKNLQLQLGSGADLQRVPLP